MGNFYKLMESRYVMPDFSWAADYASRPETMASYMDNLIRSGDTIEEIVKRAATEARKRGGRTKYTPGTIYGHIRFRVQQAAKGKHHPTGI